MPDRRNPEGLAMNRGEKSSSREEFIYMKATWQLKIRTCTLLEEKILPLKTMEEFNQTLQAQSINKIVNRRNLTM